MTVQAAMAVSGVISSIEVLTEEPAFDAFQREWEELLDDSLQRVFFLRWSWNRLWWDLFKPPRSQLYLVAMRDEESSLVGLAPLYRRDRRTLGVVRLRDLMFLGTGVYAQTSEYLDVIARRGFEKQVASRLVAFLSERADWDRLWLREVPAASTVMHSFARELNSASAGAAELAPCNRSHHIDAGVRWEQFTESLRRSTRKHLKRQTRKFFERYRCEFRRVEEVEQIDSALDALVRLHQARWRSKGQPGSFVVPNFEDFVRRAARIALAEDRLRLWTLELNREVAAVRLAFLDNGIVHAIQGGFDPAYAKDSLGSVMLGLCIKDCIEDPAVKAYDFMGGTDTYKDWWTSLGRETVTLTFIRENRRARLYRAVVNASRVVRSASRLILPQAVRKSIYEKLIKWRRHS